jgi:hypothetical protein
MIIENKINEILDYKIRVNKNFVPRSANKMLPPFFYSALFIGATGTGKTFKLVELLKLYEKYDIKYFVSNNHLYHKIFYL